MPITNHHAVIILASGLSQRLGQPKQLLSKQGEPLICAMLNLALATKPSTIVIVIPKDQPKVAAAITDLMAKHSHIIPIINPTPKTGMAHSLYLGIKALINLDSISSIDRVLLMGVDQVLLDHQHLTSLLAGTLSITASSYSHLNDDFSSNDSKANIIGLPIAIDCEHLKQWQPTLIGDMGLRYLIRALPSNQINTIINQQLSYDIDTPKQLAYAQQQGWLD